MHSGKATIGNTVPRCSFSARSGCARSAPREDFGFNVIFLLVFFLKRKRCAHRVQRNRKGFRQAYALWSRAEQDVEFQFVARCGTMVSDRRHGGVRLRRYRRRGRVLVPAQRKPALSGGPSTADSQCNARKKNKAPRGAPCLGRNASISCGGGATAQGPGSRCRAVPAS